MKIIAHRANLSGPNSKNENKLSSIKKCIDLGYDVEIDIRSESLLDSRRLCFPVRITSTLGGI